MIRKAIIALGAAFLAGLLTYAAIVVLAPEMYVEKAFHILATAFVGTAGITSLVLMRRKG